MHLNNLNAPVLNVLKYLFPFTFNLSGDKTYQPPLVVSPFLIKIFFCKAVFRISFFSTWSICSDVMISDVPSLWSSLTYCLAFFGILRSFWITSTQTARTLAIVMLVLLKGRWQSVFLQTLSSVHTRTASKFFLYQTVALLRYEYSPGLPLLYVFQRTWHPPTLGASQNLAICCS